MRHLVSTPAPLLMMLLSFTVLPGCPDDGGVPVTPSPTGAETGTPPVDETPTASPATPTAPGVTPTAPGVTPTAPLVTPTAPLVTPTAPLVTPTAPLVTPTEPGVTPTAPLVTPTEPGVTPTEPGATPTEPGVTPTEPGPTPTRPDPTPTRPGPTPTEPDPTPTRPDPTPTRPGPTPTATLPPTPTATRTPIVDPTPTGVDPTVSPTPTATRTPFVDPTPTDPEPTVATPTLAPTPTATGPTPFPDLDGDGFGADVDCDDTDVWVNPGAVERFDHKDNDCDGAVEPRALGVDKAWLFLDGYAAGGQFGRSLDGGGDVNGDQLGDLIVGAPFYDPTGTGKRRGYAAVIHGRTDWQVGVPLSLETLSRAYLYTGVQEASEAGTAVTFAGDMNGDGLTDFCIGAPRAAVNFGLGPVVDAGIAYLYLGRLSGWADGSLSGSTSKVTGILEGVRLGSSLAGGDVTGDGLADLLVGAPHDKEGFFNGSGWVFLFPGQSTSYPTNVGPLLVAQIQGEDDQAIGRALAFLGDHDATGPQDFAVGTDENTSKVGGVLTLGGTGELAPGERFDAVDLATGDLVGDQTGERLGTSVDGGVDVDGDGFTDLLVGREALDVASGGAMAYLVLGGAATGAGSAPSLADVAFMPGPGDACPCVVAGVPDMDGDGLDEVAVAAAYAEVDGRAEAGRVYLFFGRDSALSAWPSEIDAEAEADAIFYGVAAGQRVGVRLAGLADINGDGFGDLALGAPFDTPDHGAGPLTDGGRVYVQFGAPLN